MNSQELKKQAFQASTARIRAFMVDESFAIMGQSVSIADCIYEEEPVFENVIQFEELESAPAKLDDLKADVQDPLLEVNLGEQGTQKPTYISQMMKPDDQAKMIALLKEYKDCFAWDYDEMPGLDRGLVEHRSDLEGQGGD